MHEHGMVLTASHAPEDEDSMVTKLSVEEQDEIGESFGDAFAIGFVTIVAAHRTCSSTNGRPTASCDRTTIVQRLCAGLPDVLHTEQR